MKTKLIQENDTLVILLCGNEENHELVDTFPCSFLMVCSEDWNREFSPWPSPHVFKGGGDFLGEADLTLKQLLADPIMAQKWQKKIICGYSLAGLFAVYACMKIDCFDACASVSGSLWYPGLVEYIKENPLQCKEVYLSLGDKEKNSKQGVLRTVEEKTIEIQKIVSAYLPVKFEMNEGNHFNDSNGRIMKAIQYLIKR